MSSSSSSLPEGIMGLLQKHVSLTPLVAKKVLYTVGGRGEKKFEEAPIASYCIGLKLPKGVLDYGKCPPAYGILYVFAHWKPITLQSSRREKSQGVSVEKKGTHGVVPGGNEAEVALETRPDDAHHLRQLDDNSRIHIGR